MIQLLEALGVGFVKCAGKAILSNNGSAGLAEGAARLVEARPPFSLEL